MINYKTIFLMLLVMSFLGCDQESKTVKQELFGSYLSPSTSKNYLELNLRSDSTYKFISMPMQEDVLFAEYGSWDVDNGHLKLYKGIDISENIIVDFENGEYNDTLMVVLGENLVKNYPFTLSSNMDAKEYADSNQIIIKKSPYLDSIKHSYQDSWEFFIYSLEGRHNNFYFTISNAFKYKSLDLSIIDNQIFTGEQEKKLFMTLNISKDNELYTLKNGDSYDTLKYQ